MHNQSNTNIEIIKENYKKLGDEKKTNKNCVLLTTGSFNPIHRSHIKNFLLVKNYLENQSMNVLAAYISPTHDSYVRRKLSSSDWISADERCTLCETAIEEQNEKDFIAVSKGEIEYQGGFVDFDDVSRSLAQFLNSELDENIKPIKVVYVCGLDHFNKCSYVKALSEEENLACAIIYRPGSSDDYIKALIALSSNLYYITLENELETLVDISSTAIRQGYKSKNHVDLDKLTYPCVTTFYNKRFNNNQ